MNNIIIRDEQGAEVDTRNLRQMGTYDKYVPHMLDPKTNERLYRKEVHAWFSRQDSTVFTFVMNGVVVGGEVGWKAATQRWGAIMEEDEGCLL